MPNITITNQLQTPLFINFLYIELQTGESITTYRSASDLMKEATLHQMIQEGKISISIEYTTEEKASAFDIFPGLSLFSEWSGTTPLTQRYVDVNAPDGGTGAILNPFNKIQDAIDDLETIGGFNQNHPAIIFVSPGLYEETVVIHQDGINIYSTTFDGSKGSDVATIQAPTGESPLTLTNATPASLATFNASGVYSDLVNQGDAGPKHCRFIGILFRNQSTTSAHSVRLLGVRGDYSSTETEFGSGIYFFHSRFLCRISNEDFYVRNSGSTQFYDCWFNGVFRQINSSGMIAFGCANFESINSIWDDSDPDGKNRYRYGYDQVVNCSTYGFRGQPYTANNWNLYFVNSIFGQRIFTHNISMLNGGLLQVQECGGDVNFTLDGDSDLEVEASTIVGNVTLGSGPGTATWAGGGYTGTLTDPDNKLSPSKEESGSKVIRGYLSLTEDPNFDSESRHVTAQVTTDTAALTKALGITLAEGETIIAKMTVAATRVGTADHAVYTRRVMVYRDTAGSATLGPGGIQSVHTDETDATWDSDFSVTGNDLDINVTGAAGQTINWAIDVQYTRVGQ